MASTILMRMRNGVLKQTLTSIKSPTLNPILPFGTLNPILPYGFTSLFSSISTTSNSISTNNSLIYPVIQTFYFEALTQGRFRTQIDELIKLNPRCYRGIRYVPPLLPGSSHFFYHIAFETKDSGFVALFAKSDENPVSILSRNRLLVLNNDLWKFVAEEYKADRDILERNYHYGFFESSFSFNKLKTSVSVVASLEEYGGEFDFRAALSRLVSMVWGSCFWAGILDFMQFVIEVGEGDFDIELGNLERLLRDWRDVSKGVYEGKKLFVIGGEEKTIVDLRSMLTLMNSKKEERELILVVVPDLVVGTWCSVASVMPRMKNLNIIIKVLSSEVIIKKGEGKSDRNLRLNHCLVGDSTACIIFCARNEQVDLLVPGTIALLKNAKVEMFSGKMFLEVGKEGDVVDDYVKDDNFEVNTDIYC